MTNYKGRTADVPAAASCLAWPHGAMLVFDVNTAAKLAALDGQVFWMRRGYLLRVADGVPQGSCTYYMECCSAAAATAWRRSAEVRQRKRSSVEN